MVNELQEVQWAYLIDPCFQIENTAGRPVTGGWINIYIAGTRTKYYAASDFTGTLHPFNIPLDSLGSNIILVSPANKYDVFVYNKFGTLVMSRANVSPQVAGTSIVSGGVVLDSSDGTITIEQTGDNIYNLSVADIIDSVTANIDESITNIEGDIASLVSGKKDIQAPYSASGSPTKTVTSVTQNANGVITVTYSDIDLPQQVPNIEIESSTLDVVPSIDPQTNTKTFTIDTRSVTGDASFAYGDPTDTSYIASPRTSPVKLVGSSPTRMAGNDISYDGNYRRFVLKAGVYFVNFNVEASTNSVDDSTQQVYAEIAGNGNVHDRGTVTLDRTVSGQKSEIDLSSIIFAPNDNYVIEVDMGADSDVAIYGHISHWDIFRIDRGGISGGSVPGHEYLAGWGIEIDQDDRISVDPTILDQYVTQEELASAVSGLAHEYTAGDNIVIDNDTISLSDVITINARDTSSGYAMFGNIVHWGEQDYGPGWAIAGHTDNDRDYTSYNTTDHGLQNFFWGEYANDRATASVSGESMLQISEGDVKYRAGEFQDTNTLPIIWSCSQMARDITELQEAITAVTGVSADNIVDYDDADLFDKVEAIYNDGRSPIVRYTYNSTPGQGFPYSKETYFTEFFRYSEDNAHGHTDGYRFNYERHTGNYLENELIHFNSDGVKEHTLQHKSLEIEAGAGISVASGYDASTIISINPTEVATAISGLLPTGQTYSAGNGIDITNNTISVDNTVALKSDIPEQEAVEFLGLVAGNNITLTESATGLVIDSTGGGGGSYTAGNGIDITNDVISVDNTVALKTDIPDVSDFVTEAEVSGMIPEQEAVEFLELTAGDNISIASGVISVTGMPDITGLATKTELQNTAQAITGMIPNYTAGDGIEIANDEISAKLGANMSFDNNDAITVDLNGVAEDAAGLVSGNIPQMELIAGNNIQIVTSGVSAVINAVLPPSTQDVVNANSYDNPGWETAGTVTSYNPFGLAIHPDLAYSSYTIYTSRLCVKNIGSGLFYLDLFVSMSGTPRAEYASYQDYITIASGHFICPTLSNVYDEWGNKFGCIYKSTLYGTGLDYNSLKPDNAANRHFIQLHAVVATW